RVEDNLYLGEFEVSGIPRGPAGQQVDLRFTYDLSGVLEVQATIVATNKKVTHLITRYAHGLTPEQVRLAVEAMEKLKTNPRKDGVNRFLLRRAERVFAELPRDERDMLGQILDGFETALSLQDPAVIERHRAALEEFLNLHDPVKDEDEAGGVA